MLDDIRHAFRTVLKYPGYFAAAILTLAAAIGFNAAIFTVVNAVLLRSPLYPDPDQLVVLRERRLPQFPEFSVSPGNFLTWQAQATTFEGMAAHGFVMANIEAGDALERIRGDRVSTNFFDVLRVYPAIGRGFNADDDAAATAVVISHRLWQQRFGGDRDIIGHSIRLGDRTRTVVGVMPAGFKYPTPTTEFWVPIALSDAERRNHGSHYLGAIGRLKPGISLDRAQDELAMIAKNLAAERPENAGWEVLPFRLHDFAVREVKQPLLILLAAVALLLLIACVNVANLLLARGASRRKEFAIRGALGAGRLRLVRQLAAENLLLGLSGAAAGLLIGAWLLRVLLVFAPPTLPRVSEIRLDADVILFTMALSILTPLVFGLVPMIYGSRADLREALATGGREGTVAPARKLRSALVVGEIALALVLVVGAGLLVRSFIHLQRVPLGFDPENVLIGDIALPAADYPTAGARLVFLERLSGRIAALPRVKAVGLSQSLPLVGDFVASFTIEGAPPVDSTERPRMNFYTVTPRYLDAMGISILAGRGFTGQESAGAPVVVINETLARRYFPGQDPVGRRIRISQGPSSAPREIIGVAADVKQYGVAEETPAQLYEPYVQHTYLTSLTLAVKTHDSDPASLAPEIRAIVRDLDRNQAVARIRTMADVVDADISARRFSMLLLTIFGAAAVGLAAVGLYAVLAYTVGQRRQEIAIRIAHGATRGDILRMVFQGASVMAATGIAIGLGAAVALRRSIEALLFEVHPGDPVTYGTVAALLAAVAILASTVPAMRAARVDPMIALRGE